MCAARAPLAFILFALATILTGCGGSHSKTYTDAIYKFSFQYPSGWSAPTVQASVVADAVPSRVVTINGSDAQVRVVINDRVTNFRGITNGQVEHQGQNTLVFHLLTVSGRPAVQVVQQTAGLPPDHEYVHFNTKLYGYDIEMIGANGITKSDQSDFDTIVNSFKLGAKG